MSGPLPSGVGVGAADEPLWYHAPDNRRKLGPFTAAHLRQLAAEGLLRPADMLLRQGDQRWLPASEVLGLFGTSTLAPPTKWSIRQLTVGLGLQGRLNPRAC